MSEETNICGLKRKDFQREINGKKVDLYILKNKNNYEVAITNYGGHICAIMVPDKDGNFVNVCQGHDSLDNLINCPEVFLSTLVGRFGNRINKGKFTLEGKDYNLAINCGPNHLHGGPTGFHRRVWDANQISKNELQLTYVSQDMEEGFPGKLIMNVTFIFNDENELKIIYQGHTNKTTIVNMTHHIFVNLAGLKGGNTPSVENNLLTMNCGFYLPVDDTLIPTGEIKSVKNSPFDFLTTHSIGERINEAGGYDHCFVINKKNPGQMTHALKLIEPNSKRFCEVSTTEPAVQLYSANGHSGFKAYKGSILGKYSGLAIECQHFPDSPNNGHFPSVVLKPNETYFQESIYKFGVEK